MQKIILRILAVLAVIVGLMAVVMGTRVLTGFFEPGYATFPLLISYNVLMGLLSAVAGYLIWIKHKRAVSLAVFITIAHIAVLLSLITMFNDIVAEQSVKAMIFRSIIWVVIFLSVSRLMPQSKNHDT